MRLSEAFGRGFRLLRLAVLSLIIANWFVGAILFGADRFFGWTDSALLNRGYSLTIDNQRTNLVRISVDQDEFSRLAEEVGLPRGSIKIKVTDLANLCGRANFLYKEIQLDARCLLQSWPEQSNHTLLHEIGHLADPTNPFNAEYLKYGVIGGLISSFHSPREGYAEGFADQHNDVDLLSVIPVDPSWITWSDVTEKLPSVELQLSGLREEAIIRVGKQGDEIAVDTPFNGGDDGGAEPSCGDKIWLNAVPYRTEFVEGGCGVTLQADVAGSDLVVQYKGYLLGIHFT